VAEIEEKSGLTPGWITVNAWLFAAATTPTTRANMISAMAIFNNPNENPAPWHTSMIMWAFILIPLIFNLYFRKLLNTLETIAGILHISRCFRASIR